MIDTLALLPEGSQRRFDSRHRLVIAASQRAKHLMQGSRLGTTSKFTKETTIALEEVLQGKVEFLIGKEARQAMKEAKRVRDSDVERIAAVSPVVGEDAREIKKELSVYVDDSTKPTEPETEE
ncbi:MAG: DNA-directed RNA polymerase subunit omega [Nitrospiraceae bacterium]